MDRPSRQLALNSCQHFCQRFPKRDREPLVDLFRAVSPTESCAERETPEWKIQKYRGPLNLLSICLYSLRPFATEFTVLPPLLACDRLIELTKTDWVVMG